MESLCAGFVAVPCYWHGWLNGSSESSKSLHCTQSARVVRLLTFTRYSVIKLFGFDLVQLRKHEVVKASVREEAYQNEPKCLKKLRDASNEPEHVEKRVNSPFVGVELLVKYKIHYKVSLSLKLEVADNCLNSESVSRTYPLVADAVKDVFGCDPLRPKIHIVIQNHFVLPDRVSKILGCFRNQRHYSKTPAAQ